MEATELTEVEVYVVGAIRKDECSTPEGDTLSRGEPPRLHD